jgi:hypothetical protein
MEAKEFVESDLFHLELLSGHEPVRSAGFIPQGGRSGRSARGYGRGSDVVPPGGLKSALLREVHGEGAEVYAKA